MDAQLHRPAAGKLTRITDPARQALVATGLIGALTARFTAYLDAPASDDPRAVHRLLRRHAAQQGVELLTAALGEPDALTDISASAWNALDCWHSARSGLTSRRGSPLHRGLGRPALGASHRGAGTGGTGDGALTVQIEQHCVSDVRKVVPMD